jgi:UMF1 family MFS transporter
MTTTRPSAGGPRLLEALGLHRRELRAWAFYDLASAAVLDVVVTAVFPIYYSTVAAADAPPAVATGRFATTTAATLFCLAFLAPVVGRLADAAHARKRALSAFLVLGVTAVALLFFVERGDWLLASVLFLVANVGIDGAAVFHGALLPHVARREELDRTSTTACALGYVGAGLVLALVLCAIERPAWFGLPAGPGLTPAQETIPARLAFVVVAGWWLLFSIPLLRLVAEPPACAGKARSPLGSRGAGARLVATVRRLRLHRHALLFTAAVLLYNNGISTIVRMAVIFGTEIGLAPSALLLAIVVVDLVGMPFAFLFGALTERIGAKRAILGGLGVYIVAAILAYYTRTTAQFFALALLIATVQGGTQALTRSLYASLVPAERSAELFGFLAMAGKFTGMIGPALFAAVVTITGSSRSAILSVVVFFAAGAALLAAVDVEEGRAAAQDVALGHEPH